MVNPLFTSVKIGATQLEHRVVLAPLTRMRANTEHAHGEMAAEYYAQRATKGGLLITEATFISPQAGGYPTAPSNHAAKQIAGWKGVVDAVHSKGAKIFMQQWHLGRAATPDQLRLEGLEFVSASNIPMVPGDEKPRPLTLAEIKATVEDYAQSARNWIAAGGDGIEIHMANGYLINQFLDTNSNVRTDAYGGSVENRVRFSQEVCNAVVAAIGADRVGIRLSPFSTFNAVKMAHASTIETYSHLVSWFAKTHDLAYLHVVEGRVAGIADITPLDTENLNFIHDIWSPRTIILAGGYSAESGAKEVALRTNALIAYGRYFISNPDLVDRIKHNIPWTKYDRSTFYASGPKGYTDYPLATQEQISAAL